MFLYPLDSQLWALGFGSIGISAGSPAAFWQSMIGDVNAGSWFATLRSAGMGGEGLKTVQVVVGRTAALLTGSGVANCQPEAVDCPSIAFMRCSPPCLRILCPPVPEPCTCSCEP
ncbi:hypothetical protein K491DRAFT_758329 [Lophiostoma macrostomum CBS 122681]|uniref:Uncharacterized protein n=1 Tax=Lophiostoma macrostomum CBS 122681 TaxID=1314788 RepID=A0A6A6T8S8_9PLEO|nr:hypothetical protein K491DRAFT_758329 [Lophiostoma macrostomum CBS 122681]